MAIKLTECVGVFTVTWIGDTSGFTFMTRAPSREEALRNLVEALGEAWTEAATK